MTPEGLRHENLQKCRSPAHASARPGMEKLKNFPRTLGTHARNLAKICHRRSLNLLQGSEVMQKCTFARRPDAGNFLQSGLADILGAPLAVRADHESVRLVSQTLDEIQYRIARLELDRLAVRQEQGFASCIAVDALGDRHQ